MPFVLAQRVGRLIEIVMFGAMSPDDAQALRTKLALTLTPMSSRAVILADMRDCEMFSGVVADKLLAMLKQDNPRVERSAFLVRGGAFAVQVERITNEVAREAKAEGRPAPPRRSFREPALARVWLGEILEAEERAQLLRACV